MGNAFEVASQTGQIGINITSSFLKYVYKGKLEIIDDSERQRTVGDLIFTPDGGRPYTFEVKTELKNTGNLFIETYSNKSCGRRGWLHNLMDTDFLYYYFVNDNSLIRMSFQALKRWALKPDGSETARFLEFTEMPQNKFIQKNDTFGRLVPMRVLEKEVRWFQLFHPKSRAEIAADIPAEASPPL